MSEYTIVRIDVDADVVRRAARVVPGVEVPEEFDPDTRRVTPFPGDTDTPATEADVADGTGRVGQIRSLIGEYGLLAAAVALVGAGVATAGLWYYRRRNRDGESATEEAFDRSAWEMPDSAVGATAGDRLGRSESVPNPDGTPAGRTDDEQIPTAFDAPTAESDTDTDAPDDRADHGESPGPIPPETTGDDAGETPTEESTVETAVDTEDEPSEPAVVDENGSLDRAPLLGVAFVALSGAVVRWLQRES